MKAVQPVFTDSHAHLSFIADRLGPARLDAMLDAYTGAALLPTFILDPGVEPDDFPRRIEAFGHLPFVIPAAGIWPSKEALADPDAALAILAPHVADPRCRAVGECGPDFFHMNGSPEAQRRLFEGQIELACRFGKPLIVHSRNAAAETIAALASARPRIPVLIHCFGYGPAEVDKFLELGCFISFAGNVSYPAATALREACLRIPEERLLLETDAPYMNPAPHRGSHSTCLDIARTYELVARLRKTSVDALATTVTSTLLRFLAVGFSPVP